MTLREVLIEGINGKCFDCKKGHRECVDNNGNCDRLKYIESEIKKLGVVGYWCEGVGDWWRGDMDCKKRCPEYNKHKCKSVLIIGMDKIGDE